MENKEKYFQVREIRRSLSRKKKGGLLKGRETAIKNSQEVRATEKCKKGGNE